MKKVYIAPTVHIQTLEAQTMLASSTLTASGTSQVVTPGDAIHNGEFDSNKDIWGNIW